VACCFFGAPLCYCSSLCVQLSVQLGRQDAGLIFVCFRLLGAQFVCSWHVARGDAHIFIDGAASHCGLAVPDVHSDAEKANRVL